MYKYSCNVCVCACKIDFYFIIYLSAADCQTRWARLRERYYREKKLQERETRSGSGHITRSQFPLYEQMSFLFKHVKSRK